MRANIYKMVPEIYKSGVPEIYKAMPEIYKSQKSINTARNL